MRPWTVDFRELEGLPAPVGRYFRAVLKEGQPMASEVRMRHTGTFNMGERVFLVVAALLAILFYRSTPREG